VPSAGDDREPRRDVGAAARTWSEGALEAARTEHADAAEAERDAHEALEVARREEQRAVQLTATLQKHAEARGVLDALAETEAQAADDLSVLRRHEAALLVRPLLQPLEDLRTKTTEAAAARDAAVAALAALPPELRTASLDREGCSAAARALADRLAGLRAVLPREAALQRAGEAMQAALGARDDLRAELDELSSRAEELPGELDEVRRRLGESQVLGHRLDDARAGLLEATAQHEASLLLPAARSEHETLMARHLDAREQAATARGRQEQ